MTEAELMKPEMLRARIFEMMGTRRFSQDAAGLKVRIGTINDLLSQDVPNDKKKAHLLETQQAILDLAAHGYPNQALEKFPDYAKLYSQLSGE